MFEVEGDRNGGYIDACYHHNSESTIYWTGLDIDGYTQATAFSEFYKGGGGRRVWCQNMTYPCSSCCPSSSMDDVGRWDWRK